jgi:hypothetical protein
MRSTGRELCRRKLFLRSRPSWTLTGTLGCARWFSGAIAEIGFLPRVPYYSVRGIGFQANYILPAKDFVLFI